MHLFVVSLFLAAIVAVKGQDPTAVCYPPIFMMTYFNMMSEEKGFIYVDFGKEKYVELSSMTGNRFIHDFTSLRSYAITGEGNYTTCYWFKLQPSQIMYRCLPPYAKIVPPASGFFHHVTASRMQVQTWDVQTEYETVYRVVFSVVSSTSFAPIFSQQYGFHGTTELFIYTNHSTAIPDPSVFTIPNACNSRGLATIVG